VRLEFDPECFGAHQVMRLLTVLSTPRYWPLEPQPQVAAPTSARRQATMLRT
jgi:hypothetical protein